MWGSAASARRRHLRRRRCRDDSGAVTAELAMGLPLLLALTAGLVWLLVVGAAQVQVIDASREAARAVARGDDPGRAAALARRIAPDPATVRIDVVGDEVVVTTRARVEGPGGLFDSWAALTVSSRAVALMEQQ